MVKKNPISAVLLTKEQTRIRKIASVPKNTIKGYKYAHFVKQNGPISHLPVIFIRHPSQTDMPSNKIVVSIEKPSKKRSKKKSKKTPSRGTKHVEESTQKSTLNFGKKTKEDPPLLGKRKRSGPISKDEFKDIVREICKNGFMHPHERIEDPRLKNYRRTHFSSSISELVTIMERKSHKYAKVLDILSMIKSCKPVEFSKVNIASDGHVDIFGPSGKKNMTRIVQITIKDLANGDKHVIHTNKLPFVMFLQTCFTIMGMEKWIANSFFKCIEGAAKDSPIFQSNTFDDVEQFSVFFKDWLEGVAVPDYFHLLKNTE